jgi:WD40 repeat protein
MMVRFLTLWLAAGMLVIACGGDGAGGGDGGDITGPGSGSIQITTITRGGPVDPDGYRVSVDNGEALAVGISATLTIEDVAAGAHTVLLSDLSPECEVSDENPRSISVVAGSTTRVTFSVSCASLLGRLEITSATIGSAPDPDGYLVQIGGTLERAVGPNETVRLELAPGEQSVLLNGIAAGCTLEGENPRLLTVTRGAEVETTFVLSCPGIATGQLAFTTDRDGNDEIYLVNADGTGLQRLTTHPTGDFQPTWAPDGSRLAFASDRSGTANIFVMNADGSGVTNLSRSPSSDFLPAWSPDGSRIAFVRDEGDLATGWEIMVMNADGSNQVNLTNDPDFAAAPAWSPDGARLAFQSDRDFATDPTELTWEIFVMKADGTGVARVTDHDADDEFPSWSPDGRKLAFMSTRVGAFDIFVTDLVGAEPVNLTNHPNNDFRPEWSPGGERIAFSSDRYGGPGDILVMASDGTDVIRLTQGGFARDASWRP